MAEQKSFHEDIPYATDVQVVPSNAIQATSVAVKGVKVLLGELPSAPNSEVLPGIRSALRSHDALNEGGCFEFLSGHHWPHALQEAFLKNIAGTPLRFFVCDDSGSMSIEDGGMLVVHQGRARNVKCSRWTELGETIKFHAGLAQAGCISTEFRMLNSSKPISIGSGPGSGMANDFVRLFSNSPSGGTPLCMHINKIAKQIIQQASALRQHGKRACIIIATDGQSSDGNIAEALYPLKDLPCWVVVRLCTSDRSIVEYWNAIDAAVEVKVDVIDDVVAEAAEVYKWNPWLTYCEMLHRAREFGVSFREFDAIDEAKLSMEMMGKVCVLIYGEEAIQRLPNPAINLRGFCAGLEQLNAANPGNFTVWCPVRNRMTPIVNPRAIQAQYSTGHECCTIQ